MTHSTTTDWLNALGYSGSPEGLYHRGTPVPATHAYRGEIEELFGSTGIINAAAVFDVDGVPTICFIEDDGRFAQDPDALDRIREKIWNQNLISIVLVVREGDALAVPVNRRDFVGEELLRGQAHEAGPYSLRDVQSGGAFRRHPDWFTAESRVDCVLLRNLSLIVLDLERYGLKKVDAQYLVAQVLFVSYLEHREIIGETYRTKHVLGCLKDLVSARDRPGIARLFSQLKRDFNGDFLEPGTKGSVLWKTLPDEALVRLNEFLSRMDLESGQRSLWHYDFRYIPVELISGIYETFLSEEKRDVGAYYTPRHLANLVVDQAFAGSPDILGERIYDGACGSGILLTTAYRRMLAYAEAQNKHPLPFRDRRKLLEEHIFGSDINVSACRVTAFSLYLSILEGLQPADIAELQDNENVKLPSLREKNISGGPDVGDFFSEKNPHACAGRFTIFLSNPPWVEPKKGEFLSSDQWAKDKGIQIPRRQMASAFMLRARDSLAQGGRVCLILPASVVAAPTSAAFFKTWLDNYQLETLINFGDLRKLLFNTAKQPCVVAIATPRPEPLLGKIPRTETFEYWVPKADISFAFGRLTLHGSDRHFLSTWTVSQNNELLTTLFWGTGRDVSTIASLRLQGTLGNFIDSSELWLTRKGFHKHDKSILDPVSSHPLRERPYLDAKRFVVDGPVFDQRLLSAFPDNIETVARLPEDLLEVFEGPKIVFTDGITTHRSIRAAFSRRAFSFSSSIGVIAGPKEDEALLQFVAAYMHSSLAQYVLLLTAYQINFERERVTLSDIRQLPFIHPDRHANPTRAWSIVGEVAEHMRTLDECNNFFLQQYDPRILEPLIFEYFNLNSTQQARVREAANKIAPNLQPSSMAGLETPLQKRPNQSHLDDYAQALHGEIHVWRKARGGLGDVTVSISVNSNEICGPLGVVRVDPAVKGRRDDFGEVHATANDQTVNHLLQHLTEQQLLPLEIQNNLYLATDVVIRAGDTIYLVKPLIARFWLSSEAYRDAERIVRHVLLTKPEVEANR